MELGLFVPCYVDAFFPKVTIRFHTARYAVLITGPSPTADIEGVLTEGGQNGRSLTVVPLPRQR
jgi:hypothetical protein